MEQRQPTTEPAEILGMPRRDVLIAAGAALAAGAAFGAYSWNKATTAPETDGEPVVPHITYETTRITTPENMLKAGPWNYMAGAKTLPDSSLELSPVGGTIVDKHNDNKRSPDPAMNMFGPRLQVESDFMVSADIDAKTPVSLQVYGGVPLRYDDFRHEQSRVECLTAGNVLSVRTWNGDKQEPDVQTFHFNGSTTNRKVTVRREGDLLAFMVNGEQVGTTADANQLFSRGEVWFGANSEQGTAKISDFTAGPINGHEAAIVDTSTLKIAPESIDRNGGLTGQVWRTGFTLGCAFSPEFALADPQYAQIMLGGDVSRWTAENTLKPQDTQRMPGVFDFTRFDITCELAKRSGKTVHGHALMYTKALPKWMEDQPTDTEEDKQRVHDMLWTHVYTVVRHAKTQGVKSYDVVNEVIADYGSEAHIDTDHVFFKALGEKWVDVALRAAHAADPEAKLWFNENGTETNKENRDLIFGLAERVLARGAPLHGISDQCHAYKLPRDDIKPSILIEMAKRAKALGLEFSISELDVTGKDKDAQQDQTIGVVGTALKIPNCPSVTVWGLFDRYGSTTVRNGDKLEPGNALLYDVNGRPKAMYKKLASVIDQTHGFYDFS